MAAGIAILSALILLAAGAGAMPYLAVFAGLVFTVSAIRRLWQLRKTPEFRKRLEVYVGMVSTVCLFLFFFPAAELLQLRPALVIFMILVLGSTGYLLKKYD